MTILHDNTNGGINCGKGDLIIQAGGNNGNGVIIQTGTTHIAKFEKHSSTGLGGFELLYNGQTRIISQSWGTEIQNGELRVANNDIVAFSSSDLNLKENLVVIPNAVDKVGLSSPPNRVWLDIAAKPASPNNDIIGRVTLDGKGEPDVSVSLTGPAGERTVKTGKKGEFQFTNLEPGEYSVSARGAVRNTTRRSDLMKITLPASPAPPATIALKMQ